MAIQLGMRFDPYDRIIWSADVSSEGELWAALALMPKLRIVKLDRYFLTIVGLSIIGQLEERGYKVFADAKIIEIPSKALAIAELHLKYAPFMLNCMAGVLSSGYTEDPDHNRLDGLRRFAAACHEVGTRPCGVTVLTSKTPETVFREFNGRTNIDQVLFYVEELLECGFTDVVCSPKEVAAIREQRRFDCLDLNTPGIRPAGSSLGDQARVDTPASALAAGSTRLVIGRPITEGDPGENLDAIVASILAAV